MTNRTPDPRARQLAEAVHGLAREKATKLPAWQNLPISEREKATTEARLWLRAAVEAGIAPPTVAPDATSVTPGARVRPVQPSSVSESAQSPTGAPTGRLGDLPPTEDLASADNPTHLHWGLNDVLWGDDDSVIVMLSGPDREPYWLELDPERAAVLREDLAGPAEDPAPAETLIGSITIRSESVQLDNGECLRDLAVGDSVELRPDTGDEGLWIVAAFHGDYQEQITLQYAEVVDDCGNDPVIACKFSGTRHAHPVDLDGKVRPRPTP